MDKDKLISNIVEKSKEEKQVKVNDDIYINTTYLYKSVQKKFDNWKFVETTKNLISLNIPIEIQNHILEFIHKRYEFEDILYLVCKVWRNIIKDHTDKTWKL